MRGSGGYDQAPMGMSGGYGRYDDPRDDPREQPRDRYMPRDGPREMDDQRGMVDPYHPRGSPIKSGEVMAAEEGSPRVADAEADADERKPNLFLSSMNLDDPRNMREFLMAPAPKEAGVVQCSIHRLKSGVKKLYPEYRVYMKLPGEQRELFLLCGKKRANQKTSNYMITMSEDDLKRSSSNYLGKLRANFVGTEFKIYDAGRSNGSGNGEDAEDEFGSARPRLELGVVLYATNFVGARGPRRMQVGLPRVNDDGTVAVFQSTSPKDCMMTKFKKMDLADIIAAYNKAPNWNETVGAFVLNFNGRVTMASVKNFQLITHKDQEQVLLQFGRTAKDTFSMDFQWPMSPFQAFAVTLSSFDSKIACD